jgi:hypothetical protein
MCSSIRPRRPPLPSASARQPEFLTKISGTRYHEPSATDARRRIAAFFDQHLKT